MGAGVWGWNPQLGDESPPVRLARSGMNILERKRFFERTLFEQKFSYIYKAFFSFKFLSKFVFFLKERLFERTYKNSAFQTNGIRKKKMNFVRKLFNQSTLSHGKWILDRKLIDWKRFSEIFGHLIKIQVYLSLTFPGWITKKLGDEKMTKGGGGWLV